MDKLDYQKHATGKKTGQVQYLTGEGGTLSVADYLYDARGFRIMRHTYNPSTGTFVNRYDDYYNQQWQSLETYKGTEDNTVATDIYEQYVWHGANGAYIDFLAVRDRDTNGDGTLDERLYVMQDANFNVVAVADTSGDVQERYCYTPYGQRTVLASDYSVRSASNYDWRVGHQGLVQDVETGLVYNRNRMLSPGLGRFMQRDMMNQDTPRGGYQDGMSLYQYINSSPTIHLDPSGLWQYGNYCGTDNKGGKPIDAVDAACLQHDNCYAKGGFKGGVFRTANQRQYARDCGRRDCDRALDNAMRDLMWDSSISDDGRHAAVQINGWFRGACNEPNCGGKEAKKCPPKVKCKED